ncbi:MAG: toxic anion resistance protein [Erysipelotrichaceae bacterium]|nr:toxic anion resistance protein [Erysipelotrichaceae bacterium]
MSEKEAKQTLELESTDEEISLTLDPVGAAAEMMKKEEEPEAKPEISEEELKQVKYDESSLTESEKKMVEEFSKKIDITDTTTILQYGANAQTKVADFSENALKNVKTQDLGDIGGLMTDLVGQLKGFEINKEDNFFEKLFKKGANKATAMKAKYDDAEKNVEKIAKVLEGHQITLLKDIALLDQLYEKNLVNFKEISMYILAGQKKLEEVKTKDLVALQEKAKATGLPEDAQAVNDLNNAINRFEKKLHDLELTRMVSLQMAPQIRLVQNNDTLMTEKIQSVLVNTIPLWKSQMLIALGLHHSQEAIKAENAVTEMTNQMLKENAENLHIATVETAEASERGIVDLETLTETNKKLIQTLEEVAQIQKDGREKRAAAQLELRKMEIELSKRLTEIQGELENKKR